MCQLSFLINVYSPLVYVLLLLLLLLNLVCVILFSPTCFHVVCYLDTRLIYFLVYKTRTNNQGTSFLICCWTKVLHNIPHMSAAY